MKKAPSPESKVIAEEPTKKKDFFEIRIPKFTFRDTPINGFLVFTVVVFAFLLGMLTNKVIYLEKELKTAPTTASNLTPTETPYPTPPQVVKVDNGKLPLLGSKDAKVTIVEFSDFECPFCQKFYSDNWKQLEEKYINTGKVKFAYRHYPLNSIHPLAQKAGEASECANEQGMFWEYFNALFTNHATWSGLTQDSVPQTFANYAAQMGMDTDQFSTCLSSGKYANRVTEDTTAGTKAQVDGTPTFFINGYRVVGAVPFSELEQVIEQELAKVK